MKAAVVAGWDWEAAADWLNLLPCRLLGHKWFEIPETFRRSPRNPEPWKMRFVCKRCHMLSGATN